MGQTGFARYWQSANLKDVHKLLLNAAEQCLLLVCCLARWAAGFTTGQAVKQPSAAGCRGAHSNLCVCSLCHALLAAAVLPPERCLAGYLAATVAAYVSATCPGGL